eukprot:SM000701S21273  [mRNA]  locus=s701:97:1099:+ [translate_table: standard]
MRKQYTIQHSENDMVQKELELLEDDAAVYKLIGPVLVRQDLVEARANVAKRIEYITAEQLTSPPSLPLCWYRKRLDATLKQLEERQDTKRDEVLRVQGRLQQMQGPQPMQA